MDLISQQCFLEMTTTHCYKNRIMYPFAMNYNHSTCFSKVILKGYGKTPTHVCGKTPSRRFADSRWAFYREVSARRPKMIFSILTNCVRYFCLKIKSCMHIVANVFSNDITEFDDCLLLDTAAISFLA